jgi:hypothetical protein
MPSGRVSDGVPRILDLVGLAVALAFAVPVGLFGVELLLEGRALGGVYVAIAGALLAAHHLLTTPEDVPARAVQYVVGKLVRREDDP